MLWIIRSESYVVRLLNIFHIFTKHRHRDLPIFMARCKYRFTELLVLVAW
jgi:hypothetical protein